MERGQIDDELGIDLVALVGARPCRFDGVLQAGGGRVQGGETRARFKHVPKCLDGLKLGMLRMSALYRVGFLGEKLTTALSSSDPRWVSLSEISIVLSSIELLSS